MLQGYNLDSGWIQNILAGDQLNEAQAMLTSHRKNNPANEYRLVRIDDKGKLIIIVPYEAEC
jgi:hypothetical protein